MPQQNVRNWIICYH